MRYQGRLGNLAVFIWLITVVACGTEPGANSLLVGTWEMRIAKGGSGAPSSEQTLNPSRDQLREMLRNTLSDPGLKLPRLTFFQDGSGKIDEGVLGYSGSDQINWRLVRNDADRIVIMTSRPSHQEETEWVFAIESPNALQSVGGKLDGIRWQRSEYSLR